MQQPELPTVALIYVRQAENIHVEHHGFEPGELQTLLIALWLSWDTESQMIFAEQLVHYLDGTATPPTMAVGMAEIIRRGQQNPPPAPTNGAIC
jgi:hypothetical protein